VLDRCKEPGADGEPLYKDVVTALAQAAQMCAHDAARYRRPLRLASKEFTRACQAVFDELAQAAPKPYEGTPASTG